MRERGEGIDESDFMQTTDGKSSLPNREAIYSQSTPYLSSGCVMLMDTEKELEIGLGTAYKLDEMNERECLISQDIADNLALEEGDIMYLSLQMY